MSPLVRMLLLIVVLLLIPIVPFLAFGSILESHIEHWQNEPATRLATLLMVVGLLATDVLLPIPSSVISTLGGVRLGWLGGTLASWIGMTAGAIFGFILARRWGRPVALWFARDSDLETMKAASDRFGPLVLIFTRGVPVLAEASVLLMGIHRMAWSTFLPPILLSNLGIALAYSAFGDFAGRHHWLPIALAAAIAFPLLLSAILPRILGKRHVK